MRFGLNGLFRREQDAAIPLGIVVAMILVTNAPLPKGQVTSLSRFVPYLLLLAPAIAHRSWRRLIATVPLAYALIVASFPFVLFINGRNELPLTVWAMGGVGVPWYDSIEMGWQARALLDYTLLWLSFGLGMMVLQKTPVRAGLFANLLARLLAALAGTIFAVLLFRLSWGARVSGTFAKPLYTPTQYYTSLTLYFLSFACTPWFVHALYDKLVRRLAANTLRSSSNGISAECFGPDDDLTV